jgi:hypothetical protein
MTAPSSSSFTLSSPERGLLLGLVLCTQERGPARPRTLRIQPHPTVAPILPITLIIAARVHARFNWSRDGRHYRLDRWEVARESGDGEGLLRGEKEELPGHDSKTPILSTPRSSLGAASACILTLPGPAPRFQCFQRFLADRIQIQTTPGHTIASHIARIQQPRLSLSIPSGLKLSFSPYSLAPGKSASPFLEKEPRKQKGGEKGGEREKESSSWRIGRMEERTARARRTLLGRM